MEVLDNIPLRLSLEEVSNKARLPKENKTLKKTIDELIEIALDRGGNRVAKEICVGISFVGVLLDNGSMGLAYTFREELKPWCNVIEKAGQLETYVSELLPLARSLDVLDSAVGVATINAVLKPDEYEEGDTLDFLSIKEKDTVVMVGYMKPLVERLTNKVRRLYVIERTAKNENIYPDWTASILIPKADVVIISGTAVVNKTVDHLLSLSRKAREVAIVGPTTPLAPTVFKKRRVTLLSGVMVTNPKRAMKVIAQGGGTRNLRNYVKKVNVILK